MTDYTIDDIPALLASIDRSLANLPAELRTERRSRRWQVRALTTVVVVLVMVVASLVVVERQTADNRRDSRCAIRTAVVSVLDAGHATRQQHDAILGKLDADLGTGDC